MSVTYTFAVLRYVHDAVTEEFINVGVALLAPKGPFLGFRFATSYQRISALFPRADGPHTRSVLKFIARRVHQLADELGQLPLETHPPTVMDWMARVLPPDDSTLRFFDAGGGLTEDPKATLDRLCSRYVERYQVHKRDERRDDNDVAATFRVELARARAMTVEKTISAPLYEHRFPIAWENERWHLAEAQSFDLSSSSDLPEKAVRWLGRAKLLAESEEKFKLHLLLGAPQNREHLAAFEKAKTILEGMEVDHELVTEAQATLFARQVREDQERHARATPPPSFPA